MFISTSFTGLFKLINLIHLLLSTYYSQNQWCAGNSNLTAANIKKDITIFGVKGTYEDTTKKFIIKNGQLVSTYSPYLWFGTGNVSQTPGVNMSWDGATWYLIYGNWHYIYNDDSVGTNYACRLAIPSINNIISVSWNTGKYGHISSFSMGGMVCGDIVCGPIGGSGTCDLDFTVAVATSAFEGGSRSSAGYSRTIKKGYNYASYTKYSMPVTDVTGVRTSMGSRLPEKTLHVGISMLNSYNSPDSYKYNVWAKNLWIDTTKPFSY